MIALLALLLIIFCSVNCYFKIKYQYWKKRGIPHPKPTLFFGNIIEAIFLRKPFSRICQEICKKFENIPFIGFYVFWTPTIIIQDPELIKTVMIKNFSSFQDHFLEIESEVDPILAMNPLCLKRDAWKTNRSFLTPQFTVAKLKSLIPLIQKVGDDFIAYIRKQIDSSKSICFDAKDLSTRFTGESVFMAGYGLEGKSFDEKFPTTMQIGVDISSGNKLAQIKQTIGLFFPRLRRIFKSSFLGQPVPESFRYLILNAIKYRKANNVVRKDFLDYVYNLKQSGNDATEKDILGHAYMLYLDGCETSSILLTHILYELAKNPVEQEKCRIEIKSVLEKCNGNLTYESLINLEYVGATIFETLRIHPSISLMLRYCTQDFELLFKNQDNKQTNTIIEKGTIIAIPPEVIHNNPKYYPDPDVFDPNRFLTETSNSLYLGFGEGPRSCLGKNYTFFITKIFMVAVLSKFSVRINKNSVPYQHELIHLLNVPKKGICVDLIEIKDN